MRTPRRAIGLALLLAIMAPSGAAIQTGETLQNVSRIADGLTTWAIEFRNLDGGLRAIDTYQTIVNNATLSWSHIVENDATPYRITYPRAFVETTKGFALPKFELKVGPNGTWERVVPRITTSAYEVLIGSDITSATDEIDARVSDEATPWSLQGLRSGFPVFGLGSVQSMSLNRAEGLWWKALSWSPSGSAAAGLVVNFTPAFGRQNYGSEIRLDKAWLQAEFGITRPFVEWSHTDIPWKPLDVTDRGTYWSVTAPHYSTIGIHDAASGQVDATVRSYSDEATTGALTGSSFISDSTTFNANTMGPSAAQQYNYFGIGVRQRMTVTRSGYLYSAQFQLPASDVPLRTSYDVKVYADNAGAVGALLDSSTEPGNFGYSTLGPATFRNATYLTSGTQYWFELRNTAQANGWPWEVRVGGTTSQNQYGGTCQEFDGTTWSSTNDYGYTGFCRIQLVVRDSTAIVGSDLRSAWMYPSVAQSGISVDDPRIGASMGLDVDNQDHWTIGWNQTVTVTTNRIDIPFQTGGGDCNEGRSSPWVLVNMNADGSPGSAITGSVDIGPISGSSLYGGSTSMVPIIFPSTFTLTAGNKYGLKYQPFTSNGQAIHSCAVRAGFNWGEDTFLNSWVYFCDNVVSPGGGQCQYKRDYDIPFRIWNRASTSSVASTNNIMPANVVDAYAARITAGATQGTGNFVELTNGAGSKLGLLHNGARTTFPTTGSGTVTARAWVNGSGSTQAILPSVTVFYTREVNYVNADTRSAGANSETNALSLTPLASYTAPIVAVPVSSRAQGISTLSGYTQVNPCPNPISALISGQACFDSAAFFVYLRPASLTSGAAFSQSVQLTWGGSFEITVPAYVRSGDYIMTIGVLKDSGGTPLNNIYTQMEVTYSNGSALPNSLGKGPSYYVLNGNFFAIQTTNYIEPGNYAVQVSFTDTGSGVVTKKSWPITIGNAPILGVGGNKTYADAILYYSLFDNRTGAAFDEDFYKFYVSPDTLVDETDRVVDGTVPLIAGKRYYFAVRDYFGHTIFPQANYYCTGPNGEACPLTGVSLGNYAWLDVNRSQTFIDIGLTTFQVKLKNTQTDPAYVELAANSKLYQTWLLPGEITELRVPQDTYAVTTNLYDQGLNPPQVVNYAYNHSASSGPYWMAVSPSGDAGSLCQTLTCTGTPVGTGSPANGVTGTAVQCLDADESTGRYCSTPAAQNETLYYFGTLDLNRLVKATNIKLHLWDGDSRTYYGYRVEASADPPHEGWAKVFDSRENNCAGSSSIGATRSGTSATGATTPGPPNAACIADASGNLDFRGLQTLTFGARDIRYVRIFLTGNTVNAGGHLTEVLVGASSTASVTVDRDFFLWVRGYDLYSVIFAINNANAQIYNQQVNVGVHINNQDATIQQQTVSLASLFNNSGTFIGNQLVEMSARLNNTDANITNQFLAQSAEFSNTRAQIQNQWVFQSQLINNTRSDVLNQTNIIRQEVSNVESNLSTQVNGVSVQIHNENTTLQAQFNSIVSTVENNGLRPPPSAAVAAYALDETTGSLARDASGGGHHALVNGTPLWGAGKYGGALYFDQSGQRATASLDGLSNHSVSVSFWWQADTTTASPMHALSLFSGDALTFKYDPVSTTFAYSVNVSGAPISGTLVSGVANGTWYHSTLTYDGDHLRAFLNETLQDDVLAPGEIVGSQPVLSLGGTSQAGSSWKGGLDEVWVFGRAIGQSEVQALDENLHPAIIQQFNELNQGVQNTNSTVFTQVNLLSGQVTNAEANITTQVNRVEARLVNSESNVTNQLTLLNATIQNVNSSVVQQANILQGRIENVESNVTTQLNDLSLDVVNSNTSLHEQTNLLQVQVVNQNSNITTQFNALSQEVQNAETNLSVQNNLLSVQIDNTNASINSQVTGARIEVQNANASIHAQVNTLSAQVANSNLSIIDQVNLVRAEVNTSNSTVHTQLNGVTSRIDVFESRVNTSFALVQSNISFTQSVILNNISEMNASVYGKMIEVLDEVGTRGSDAFNQTTRILQNITSGNANLSDEVRSRTLSILADASTKHDAVLNGTLSLLENLTRAEGGVTDRLVALRGDVAAGSDYVRRVLGIVTNLTGQSNATMFDVLRVLGEIRDSISDPGNIITLPGVGTDTFPPSSAVVVNAALNEESTIVVSWSSNDVGTSVERVDLYGRREGTDWGMLLTGGQRGDYRYRPAVDGATYEFKTISTDAVGNVEAQPTNDSRNYARITYQKPSFGPGFAPTDPQSARDALFRPLAVPGLEVGGCILALLVALAIQARRSSAGGSRLAGSRKARQALGSTIRASAFLLALLAVVVIAATAEARLSPPNRFGPTTETGNLPLHYVAGQTTTIAGFTTQSVAYKATVQATTDPSTHPPVGSWSVGARPIFYVTSQCKDSDALVNCDATYDTFQILLVADGFDVGGADGTTTGFTPNSPQVYAYLTLNNLVPVQGTYDAGMLCDATQVSFPATECRHGWTLPTASPVWGTTQAHGPRSNMGLDYVGTYRIVVRATYTNAGPSGLTRSFTSDYCFRDGAGPNCFVSTDPAFVGREIGYLQVNGALTNLEPREPTCTTLDYRALRGEDVCLRADLPASSWKATGTISKLTETTITKTYAGESLGCYSSTRCVQAWRSGANLGARILQVDPATDAVTELADWPLHTSTCNAGQGCTPTIEHAAAAYVPVHGRLVVFYSAPTDALPNNVARLLRLVYSWNGDPASPPILVSGQTTIFSSTTNAYAIVSLRSGEDWLAACAGPSTISATSNVGCQVYDDGDYQTAAYSDAAIDYGTEATSASVSGPSLCLGEDATGRPANVYVALARAGAQPTNDILVLGNNSGTWAEASTHVATSASGLSGAGGTACLTNAWHGNAAGTGLPFFVAGHGADPFDNANTLSPGVWTGNANFQDASQTARYGALPASASGITLASYNGTIHAITTSSTNPNAIVARAWDHDAWAQTEAYLIPTTNQIATLAPGDALLWPNNNLVLLPMSNGNLALLRLGDNERVRLQLQSIATPSYRLDADKETETPSLRAAMGLPPAAPLDAYSYRTTVDSYSNLAPLPWTTLGCTTSCTPSVTQSFVAPTTSDPDGGTYASGGLFVEDEILLESCSFDPNTPRPVANLGETVGWTCTAKDEWDTSLGNGGSSLLKNKQLRVGINHQASAGGTTHLDLGFTLTTDPNGILSCPKGSCWTIPSTGASTDPADTYLGTHASDEVPIARNNGVRVVFPATVPFSAFQTEGAGGDSQAIFDVDRQYYASSTSRTWPTLMRDDTQREAATIVNARGANVPDGTSVWVKVLSPSSVMMSEGARTTTAGALSPYDYRVPTTAATGSWKYTFNATPNATNQFNTLLLDGPSFSVSNQIGTSNMDVRLASGTLTDYFHRNEALTITGTLTHADGGAFRRLNADGSSSARSVRFHFYTTTLGETGSFTSPSVTVGVSTGAIGANTGTIVSQSATDTYQNSIPAQAEALGWSMRVYDSSGTATGTTTWNTATVPSVADVDSDYYRTSDSAQWPVLMRDDAQRVTGTFHNVRDENVPNGVWVFVQAVGPEGVVASAARQTTGGTTANYDYLLPQDAPTGTWRAGYAITKNASSGGNGYADDATEQTWIVSSMIGQTGLDVNLPGSGVANYFQRGDLVSVSGTLLHADGGPYSRHMADGTLQTRSVVPHYHGPNGPGSLGSFTGSSLSIALSGAIPMDTGTLVPSNAADTYASLVSGVAEPQDWTLLVLDGGTPTDANGNRLTSSGMLDVDANVYLAQYEQGRNATGPTDTTFNTGTDETMPPDQDYARIVVRNVRGELTNQFAALTVSREARTPFDWTPWPAPQTLNLTFNNTGSNGAYERGFGEWPLWTFALVNYTITSQDSNGNTGPVLADPAQPWISNGKATYATATLTPIDRSILRSQTLTAKLAACDAYDDYAQDGAFDCNETARFPGTTLSGTVTDHYDWKNDTDPGDTSSFTQAFLGQPSQATIQHTYLGTEAMGYRDVKATLRAGPDERFRGLEWYIEPGASNVHDRGATRDDQKGAWLVTDLQLESITLDRPIYHLDEDATVDATLRYKIAILDEIPVNEPYAQLVTRIHKAQDQLANAPAYVAQNTFSHASTNQLGEIHVIFALTPSAQTGGEWDVESSTFLTAPTREAFTVAPRFDGVSWRAHYGSNETFAYEETARHQRGEEVDLRLHLANNPENAPVTSLLVLDDDAQADILSSTGTYDAEASELGTSWRWSSTDQAEAGTPHAPWVTVAMNEGTTTQRVASPAFLYSNWTIGNIWTSRDPTDTAESTTFLSGAHLIWEWANQTNVRGEPYLVSANYSWKNEHPTQHASTIQNPSLDPNDPSTRSSNHGFEPQYGAGETTRHVRTGFASVPAVAPTGTWTVTANASDGRGNTATRTESIQILAPLVPWALKCTSLSLAYQAGQSVNMTCYFTQRQSDGTERPIEPQGPVRIQWYAKTLGDAILYNLTSPTPMQLAFFQSNDSALQAQFGTTRSVAWSTYTLPADLALYVNRALSFRVETTYNGVPIDHYAELRLEPTETPYRIQPVDHVVIKPSFPASFTVRTLLDHPELGPIGHGPDSCTTSPNCRGDQTGVPKIAIKGLNPACSCWSTYNDPVAPINDQTALSNLWPMDRDERYRNVAGFFGYAYTFNWTPPYSIRGQDFYVVYVATFYGKSVTRYERITVDVLGEGGADPLSVKVPSQLVVVNETLLLQIESKYLNASARTGAASSIYLTIKDAAGQALVNAAHPIEDQDGIYTYAWTPTTTGVFRVIATTAAPDGSIISAANTFRVTRDTETAVFDILQASADARQLALAIQEYLSGRMNATSNQNLILLGAAQRYLANLTNETSAEQRNLALAIQSYLSDEHNQTRTSQALLVSSAQTYLSDRLNTTSSDARSHADQIAFDQSVLSLAVQAYLTSNQNATTDALRAVTLDVQAYLAARANATATDARALLLDVQAHLAERANATSFETQSLMLAIQDNLSGQVNATNESMDAHLNRSEALLQGVHAYLANDGNTTRAQLEAAYAYILTRLNETNLTLHDALLETEIRILLRINATSETELTALEEMRENLTSLEIQGLTSAEWRAWVQTQWSNASMLANVTASGIQLVLGMEEKQLHASETEVLAELLRLNQTIQEIGARTDRASTGILLMQAIQLDLLKAVIYTALALLTLGALNILRKKRSRLGASLQRLVTPISTFVSRKAILLGSIQARGASIRNRRR